MHWLTVIGLVFILIGTAFTFLGQQKLSDKSNKLLQEKSDEITELSHDNIKLSKSNAELSQQSLNLITGGDSWAFLSGGIYTAEGIANQPFMLILNHVGDNPLYDVKIVIYEIEFNTNGTHKSHTLSKIYDKDIGTLTKTLQAESLDIIELPKKDRVDFKIKLNARNGEITQHWILIKKSDNSWSTAKKVFKHTPNNDGGFLKIDLFQQIDPNFPVKNIEWIEI